MPHHGHFVQSGLTIEDDDIIISDVSLHFVTKLQMEVAWFGMKLQINPLSIVSDNVFSTWVLVIASPHKLLHAKQQGRKDHGQHNPTEWKFDNIWYSWK